MLQLKSLSRRCRKDSGDYGDVLDIAAGSLPTARRPKAGDRQVYLGIPRNCLRNIWWTITWGFGTLVYALSVPYCYLLLRMQRNEVKWVWIGFQSVWMLLRLIFFQIAKGADTLKCHPPERKLLAKLENGEREKLWNLLLGLARYQISFHPRGSYSYNGALESIETVFKAHFQDKLPSHIEEKPEIVRITGVVDDTILSAAAWLKGSEHDTLSFYDCCVVSVTHDRQDIAVPACRVLYTLDKEQNDDKEKGNKPELVPRGGPNRGRQYVGWCSWMPLPDCKWLQVKSRDLTVTGEDKEIRVMTDTELDDALNTRDMCISLEKADQVRSIVEMSSEIWHDLLDIKRGK
ncbi:hypothetical protein Asppvi_003762 [Aspergillus pseudoviridinutans]|uniref:Uncharacterized protein n=1 Tax=Aspergillus pseudoviridinutans TaxID=1517512 RepID=A0A9P3ER44_9EURO|nr:uncharacterized protein Asppvi_003762 [Aspergillus pseudoviridinutans]GIJ84911.1 hypothetical protein Asppvi_003762 [Aspergillus pseudoviridinutans]